MRLSKLAAIVRTIGTVIAGEIGRDEVYLVTALALIAVGFWDFWRPGAYLVPGAILLALRFVAPVLMTRTSSESTLAKPRRTA